MSACCLETLAAVRASSGLVTLAAGEQAGRVRWLAATSKEFCLEWAQAELGRDDEGLVHDDVC